MTEDFPLEEFDDDAAQRAWERVAEELGVTKTRRIPEGEERKKLIARLGELKKRETEQVYQA